MTMDCKMRRKPIFEVKSNGNEPEGDKIESPIAIVGGKRGTISPWSGPKGVTFSKCEYDSAVWTQKRLRMDEGGVYGADLENFFWGTAGC